MSKVWEDNDSVALLRNKIYEFFAKNTFLNMYTQMMNFKSSKFARSNASNKGKSTELVLCELCEHFMQQHKSNEMIWKANQCAFSDEQTIAVYIKERLPHWERCFYFYFFFYFLLLLMLLLLLLLWRQWLLLYLCFFPHKILCKITKTKRRIQIVIFIICCVLTVAWIRGDAYNMLYSRMKWYLCVCVVVGFFLSRSLVSIRIRLLERKLFTCGTTNRLCYRWHHCNRHQHHRNM